MKKVLVMAVAVIFSISASAQLISSNTITRHEKKGYNRLGISYNSISTGDMEVTMNGVSLSWAKGISLTNSMPLFLEVGIGATYASGSEDDDDYKFTEKMAALTVPVNVTYRFDISGSDFSIAPYAGLYLRGILYGNEIESSYYYGYEEDYDWYSNWEDVSRIQVGFDIGVNFEYKKAYLGLGYATDFNALYDEDSDTARLGTFVATLGLKF